MSSVSIAALSAFENGGHARFRIGCAVSTCDDGRIAMRSIRCSGRRATEWRARRRNYLATDGFLRRIAKARFIACAKPALSADVSERFPLRLNTGRVRDQWHTMTRSGQKSATGQSCARAFRGGSSSGCRECRKLADGAFARVSSAYGTCVLKVTVTDSQRRGSLFAPIHWNDKTASEARVGDLVTPANDPYSGQPEAKATPAGYRACVTCLSGLSAGSRASDDATGERGGRAWL